MAAPVQNLILGSPADIRLPEQKPKEIDPPPADLPGVGDDEHKAPANEEKSNNNVDLDAAVQAAAKKIYDDVKFIFDKHTEITLTDVVTGKKPKGAKKIEVGLLGDKKIVWLQPDYIKNQFLLENFQKLAKEMNPDQAKVFTGILKALSVLVQRDGDLLDLIGEAEGKKKDDVKKDPMTSEILQSCVGKKMRLGKK